MDFWVTFWLRSLRSPLDKQQSNSAAALLLPLCIFSALASTGCGLRSTNAGGRIRAIRRFGAGVNLSVAAAALGEEEATATGEGREGARH